MNLPAIDGKKLFYAALVICVGLYVAQFAFLLKYAVNVPFWDEWEAINKGGILVDQSLSQLFAQHNEHRIVTTKLLTLILYYFDGWNLVTHQAINFVIYGILLVTVAYIVKKSTPELSAWILPCFVIFMLTDVSIENHFWGFQSQFHFSLLFLFLSIWFLFNENQAWTKIVLGSLFSVLSIYSFSSGLVCSVVVLTGYVVFKGLRIYSTKERRDAFQAASAFFLIAGAIGLYFVGFTRPDSLPLTLPYQKLFWTYLLNLFSGGFGFKIDNIAPGVIVFFFTLVPVFGVIRQSGRQMSAQKWVIIISMLAVLAALVTITMGRAGYGKGHSKASRYSEITIMLIPFSVAIWAIFLKEYDRVRTYILAGFWIFCCVGLWKYFSFQTDYAKESAERRQALECVSDYYRNGGEANCPTAYPSPIAERLEFVRDVPVSFIREINK